MYWPEYGPRTRSRHRFRWGSAILCGLFLGILGVVVLDGWWRVLLAGEREEVMLPTPIAATATLQVVGSAAAPAGDERPAPATLTTGLAAARETVAVARRAPDFTLPDLFTSTKMIALNDYHGRPVILNFWASWCVPCRREMPALQAIAAGYADDGLVLLGMNQTYIDDLVAARAFAEELGLTFPNTRDDGGEVGSDAYQVVGIPTTVFIDRQGHVAHLQIGEMSLEQMTTYTERLLAGERLQP